MSREHQRLTDQHDPLEVVKQPPTQGAVLVLRAEAAAGVYAPVELGPCRKLDRRGTCPVR